MGVRAILELGEPHLRAPAREVGMDEIDSPALQALIDDLVETRRNAYGAGLAANQVAELVRVAVAEVEGVNPRYPYKPPIPLTVMINPRIEPVEGGTVTVNEGCLSVPNLRGEVERHMAVRVRYLDRTGEVRDEIKRGLTAGTIQHEVDHLDGVLFLDRVKDTRSLATWEQFERYQRDEFARRAAEIEAGCQQ